MDVALDIGADGTVNCKYNELCQDFVRLSLADMVFVQRIIDEIRANARPPRKCVVFSLNQFPPRVSRPKTFSEVFLG